MLLQKIISGGQTGADRAALDFAIRHGIPHGGWCPHGRQAEDGLIDARYQLVETPSDNPAQRTEWNVRDSDATLIVSISQKLAGGSLKTLEFARAQNKPNLHLCREADGTSAPGKLASFLKKHDVKVLNVAGSRAKEEPEVGTVVTQIMQGLIEIVP